MRFRGSFLVALALSVVSGLAHAQTTVGKKTLTLEGAKAVAAAAVAEATKGHEGASIAVVDDGGNLMYLERLQPTFPMGATISTEKARTAALFQKPSKLLEDAIVGGRTPLLNVWSAPLNGGEPIVVDGQVVGAVGVSGASSAARDAAIAIAAAAAVGTQTSAAPAASPLSLASAQSGEAAVRYLGHGEVAAAFAKGTPMIEVRDYKVHASRREGPGMVEVHTRDTDIAYVLQGSATLVTGGAAVGLKEIGAEELRGSAIEGGETRQLEPGDVVVIPNGTPHWFKTVRAPFLYYVVKVRQAERVATAGAM